MCVVKLTIKMHHVYLQGVWGLKWMPTLPMVGRVWRRYYRVFKQDKVAYLEQETAGYNMVNVGVAYAGNYANKQDYRVYFKANNLLDDEVYSHTSFLSNIPQVGRNFTVGVEFGF